MKIIVTIGISFLISLNTVYITAQTLKTGQISQTFSLDSLRKKEEDLKKSIEPSAKNIRYTLAEWLTDGRKLIPIDTTIQNFQDYSPIAQAKNPSIGLGSIGLAYRNLLFDPSKKIGFDVGFHALDAYLLTLDAIRYYETRSPYTELYYMDGKLVEQLFSVIHSQNIKPNWNFGLNYKVIDAAGFYTNQNAKHANAAFSTWFESKNKCYRILTTALINTLQAGENGSILDDNIFSTSKSSNRMAEQTRLSAQGINRPRQTWKTKTFFLKQFYALDKKNSVGNKTTNSPKQNIAHAITYSSNEYRFYRNEMDLHGTFPIFTGSPSLTTTDDFTQVENLKNEISYHIDWSSQSAKAIRNGQKLHIGLQHDGYQYQQLNAPSNFYNITLKTAFDHYFSNQSTIGIDLQHITNGKNRGDFLYEAKTAFVLSSSAGKIILDAYSEKKSPEQLFERVNYQFRQWNFDFKKTNINQLSFLYENQQFNLHGKAAYFIISNYLYYQEMANRQIKPIQHNAAIKLLKISIAKNFRLWKFCLDNYIVYQQTADRSILSTPELYTYTSFYYKDFLFKKMHTNIGIDIRYHTAFEAPSYAIDLSQFYRNTKPTRYPSYPIVDVWIKATLKRTNLFLKYDYVNQGMPSKGFYTVNQYPMQDAMIRFGLSWKFYN